MTSVRITRQPLPPIDHGAKQTARPLTHHQILALVGPFSRRARRPDLIASPREERRLAFVPLDHPAPGEGLPALREELPTTATGTEGVSGWAVAASGSAAAAMWTLTWT